MAYLNKAQIIGNLGADPEIRYLPNGQKVANFSVATTERWTDKSSGEKREHTEWHNVTLYRNLAEVAGEYLKKGSQVYVEGKQRTERWQDKDTGADRNRTVIVGQELQMLGRAAKDGDNVPSRDDGDDIPF